MPNTPSSDQQKIIDSVLTQPFTAVSAGAGTGKTYTTIEVVIEMLEKGHAKGHEFALITFTNKAAAELRHRIQKRLQQLVTSASTPQEKSKWWKHLEQLQLSFVGTIHSFCRQILLVDGYRHAAGINTNHTPNMRMDLFDLQQIAYNVLDNFVQTRTNEIENLLFTQQTTTLRLADIKDFEVVNALVAGITILRGSGKIVEEYCTKARNRKPLDTYTPIDTTQMIDTNEINRANQINAQQRSLAINKHRQRMLMLDLLEEVNKQYIVFKQQENIIDQEDLLLLTHRVLEDDAVLKDRITTRYPNLFVDEFQDTDQTQKMIVDTLFPVMQGTAPSTVTHRVLVVGDRKQSIYGFRGADVELLQLFATERQIPLLPLTESRRPTSTLATKFNALFEEIDKRCFPMNETPFSGDSLQSARDITNKDFLPVHNSVIKNPVVTRSITRESQIDQLQRDIENLQKKNIPLEAMAILVRSNRQVAEIMEHSFFMQHAVSDSQGTFWQKPEILDTLNVLRWVEYEKATTIAHTAIRSFWFYNDLTNQQALGEVTNTGITQFGNPMITNFVNDLRVLKTHKSALHILKELFQFSDVWDFLSEQQQQNLKHLYALANDIYKNGDALTLSEFVKWFEHKVLTEQEEQDSAERLGLGNGGRIKVMTIHQAKGLEFPIVFMPFMERTLKGDHYNPKVLIHDEIGIDFHFDKVKALDFETYAQQIDRLRLEEELRILYVGVTRTKDQLYLYGETRGSGSIDGVYWSWWDEILAANL